jgi:hypothetical protein
VVPRDGGSNPRSSPRIAAAKRFWLAHRAKSGLGLGFGTCNRDLARRGPCARRAVRWRRGRRRAGAGVRGGAVPNDCELLRDARSESPLFVGTGGWAAAARIWRAGPDLRPRRPGSAASARIWRAGTRTLGPARPAAPPCPATRAVSWSILPAQVPARLSPAGATQVPASLPIGLRCSSAAPPDGPTQIYATPEQRARSASDPWIGRSNRDLTPAAAGKNRFDSEPGTRERLLTRR